MRKWQMGVDILRRKEGQTAAAHGRPHEEKRGYYMSKGASEVQDSGHSVTHSAHNNWPFK